MFAWIWTPGSYLRSASAPFVLSIALSRGDGSPRRKEVIELRRSRWMQPLRAARPDALDDHVRARRTQAHGVTALSVAALSVAARWRFRIGVAFDW